MANRINHDAPIRDYWLIVYITQSELLFREHLVECLHGVDIAVVRMHLNLDTFFTDCDIISLFWKG